MNDLPPVRLSSNAFRRKAFRRPSQSPSLKKVLNTKKLFQKISFNDYPSFVDILFYLGELTLQYPARAKIQEIGESTENRSLTIIRITNGDNSPNKNVIFIDAGIHAREWMAPVVAIYVIYQLVEEFEKNKDLLASFDWIVMPLVNPDGYVHSRMKDSMWRKTRSKNHGPCIGTDANRNFSFHWKEPFSSSDPCSEVYRGSCPFSEPESRALAYVLLQLKGKGKMNISLHSFGSYFLYPWAWTSDLTPSHTDMEQVAQAGAAAIRKATGTRYRHGTVARTLYPASGCSTDYAMGVAGFPIAITMELSGKGFNFQPPPQLIQESVEEAWIGIKAMAIVVIDKYRQSSF